MNDDTVRSAESIGIDDRIAGLSPQKRTLLGHLLTTIDVAPAKPQGAKTERRRNPAELSFAQQRLWFLEQWEGGGAQYNIGQGWWLQGPLEVTQLRAAVAQLVARHEALRTVFVSDEGRPRQQVLADLAVEVPLLDLAALPADEARRQALAQARVLARQGFDLAQAPLLRLTLIRVAASTHLLVLVMHHIVSDGWSMGVLWRELTALYAGHGEQLPALPVQYADYAQWQRETLQGAALDQQLAYWRTRLAGLPPLELPTDRPRPPVQGYRGARHPLALPAELSAALNELSRRERVTPYMLLLAAFQVLLARYSGQEDIAVGSPIAGRSRREFEGLIGFFVNTLVLRSDLSGNPRFRELLARVREHALDAYAHQEVPFEKLVEELKPQRDLSRSPLIQAMFALQNAPGGELALPGLEVTAQPLDTATAKFDLTLSLTERPEGLRGGLEYATDLFDAATIARLAGHFTTLLEGIVADPDTPIGKLPLLTPAERHQLLVEWNDTAADYPRDQCVHQLFEAQVARSPAATAVVAGARTLSYAELNARANQLAHYLRRQGVGPDVLVGLCLERSPELVVGLLAILKAGGAYVPLDPSYPAQRLAFMLTDAAVPVLLTQQSLRDTLPPTAAALLCLDAPPPELPQQPTHNPTPGTGPEHLAYVIYTSGSTGTPKGVMVPHRAIARLVCNTDYIQLGPTDGVAQVANPAFDAATFEIWGALVNGSRLVIIPREVALDPLRLGDALRRDGAATLFLTTALFNEVVRARPKAFAGLQQVLFGGEAVDPHWVRACVTAGGPQRLLHVYGPTETTTFATWHPVTAVAPGQRTLPIGRPIANTVAYVLDGYRQPVPVGVAGELYLGGDGLARGYWNRPELTAERFVPDPFRGHPGARLYRTGDRVRYLPDGNLEFLGRLDQQLKLRGFRIEPGEIEAVLLQQPQVRAALVVPREEAPGDLRLVAYVVAQGETLAVADLRAALKRQLPEYMIPAAFVRLPALPLTPNGKIDHKALPAPEWGRAADAFVPPHDAIEVQLMRLWEKLLGRYPVGVTDDFFELGGHSLLAVQVVDRVNQLFDRALPIDVLWHGGRTIETLAALLRDQAGKGAPLWARAVPFRANGSRRPLFGAPVAGGHLYFYDNLARYLDPEQPVYGLPARGTDSHDRPHTTIEAMAAHALGLMREVQPVGPYSLIGYCSGGVVAFEMACQLAAQGETVARLVLVDSVAPGAGTGLRSWGRSALAAAKGSNRRLFQERVYQLLLHPLRLGRLRRLEKPGEAHRWALWSYRPGPYAGRAVLIRPSAHQHARDPALGWRRHVKGGVEVRTLTGAHGDLVTVRGAAHLAAELTRWLD